MPFVCEITFFWKGERRKISVVPEKAPLSKSDAEAIVWTAIRGWFETEKVEIPEFVRNVQLGSSKEYQWDIVTLRL